MRDPCQWIAADLQTRRDGCFFFLFVGKKKRMGVIGNASSMRPSIMLTAAPFNSFISLITAENYCRVQQKSVIMHIPVFRSDEINRLLAATTYIRHPRIRSYPVRIRRRGRRTEQVDRMHGDKTKQIASVMGSSFIAGRRNLQLASNSSSVQEKGGRCGVGQTLMHVE